MRHQIPRSEMSQSCSNSGNHSSSNNATAASGSNANNVTPALATPSSSASPMTQSQVRGPLVNTPPHSVIRTLRQMTMENSSERRTSFVSPSSATVNALLTNLDAVHNAEMKSIDNPATIVRNIVGTMQNLIKEMRSEGDDKGSVVQDMSDVATLKQRLSTLERANSMMNIHLDLIDLQRKLEISEDRKLDDRKSFVLLTREELYKEIVQLLEAEFSCSICGEVFVSACVTKCGHSYCEYCIAKWTRDKMDCPICRTMIFADWGKHVEMDNFITRLHLRLSDEIRQSREALVQERVLALEQLRTTPRRNEGASFIDALRLIRDQQGRTTSTTARALAERFRAMRRSATDANMDEASQGPSSAPSTSTDGPSARMRARLVEELETLRQHQQQSLESLNRLSRPGGSGGHSSSSPSVARIRVRPSPGVSFTLVAPRSMLSSQQSSPTTTLPHTSTSSAAIRAPADARESPASPGVISGDVVQREIRDGRTTESNVATSSTSSEDNRRGPHGLLMARYSLRHLQYLQSQQAARSGLERAVTHTRASSSTRVESPTTQPLNSPSTSAVTNMETNTDDVQIIDEESPSAANAVRTIRSIFSSLDTPTSPSLEASSGSGSPAINGNSNETVPDPSSTTSSTVFPYTLSSFRLVSGNQANANFPFPHGTSRSMSSRLSALVGSETSTTLSSSGRPITSTMQIAESDCPTDNSTSSNALATPIRNASCEILRAFSETTRTAADVADNTNTTAPLNDSNLEDSTTSTPNITVPENSAMSLANTEAELDIIDRRIRLGQVSLRDAIAAFRQRFEHVIIPGLSSNLPPPEQDIVPDIDMNISSQMPVVFPACERGTCPSLDVNANGSSGQSNGASTTEDGSIGGVHCSSPLELRPRSRRGMRTSEERPRLLHHLRESRRRRRDRSHRDGGNSRSRERRGRETTITISFCNRGDEERSNSSVAEGQTLNSLASGNRSISAPTTPTVLTARPSTSSVSDLDVPPILPLVMECDSDTPPSPGPSSAARGGEDRNANTDSILGNANSTQINNGTSASERPDLNTEDIEILFSDIEDV